MAANDQISAAHTAEPRDMEKNEVDADNGDFSPEKVDSDSEYKQEGVKAVEAITQVWSRKVVIITLVLIYLISFVGAFQQSVQQNLTPYVTSAFNGHGLLATTSIVSTIVGGVFKLTIAKMIDIWGRVVGFIFMLLLITVGLIMKAVCKNVETYAAAQTLYWVGHLGLLYIIDVVIADMTTLKNRMIIFGLTSTPTIATVFAGSKIAQLYYDNLNFRWAFGSWAIILVGFCIPILAIFIYHERKAKKFGLYPERPQNRTWWEATKHYVIEFDVVGLLLTSAGFSLILLPFSLADSAPDGWKTGYIIAMFVLGGVCLIGFVLWEKYVAPVQYLPWEFLKDRNILGGSLVYGFMFISIYCWDTYYSSYLQVVNNLNITISGYVLNSFSLASAFLSPFIGLAIRYTGNYKYIGMTGIPFMVLGTALLVKFRTPESGVGYLVMCQLFNGFGSGIFSMCAQICIMSAVSHQEIAVVLAIYGLFGSIGAAIGETIAGSLWTNMLPKQLYKDLPEGSKNLTATLYGSIVNQKKYPVGTPVREAVIEAYGYVMHRMVIAGAVFIIPVVACLFIWKNINVKTLEKTKGTQAKGNIF